MSTVSCLSRFTHKPIHSTVCTNIDNCADIRCTNSSDHTCNLCRSNNGPGLGEAAFTNLGDECEGKYFQIALKKTEMNCIKFFAAKCSWLGVFCYPGECPGDPTSCNCTEGFDGDSCLESKQLSITSSFSQYKHMVYFLFCMQSQTHQLFSHVPSL